MISPWEHNKSSGNKKGNSRIQLFATTTRVLLFCFLYPMASLYPALSSTLSAMAIRSFLTFLPYRSSATSTSLVVVRPLFHVVLEVAHSIRDHILTSLRSLMGGFLDSTHMIFISTFWTTRTQYRNALTVVVCRLHCGYTYYDTERQIASMFSRPLVPHRDMCLASRYTSSSFESNSSVSDGFLSHSRYRPALFL